MSIQQGPSVGWSPILGSELFITAPASTGLTLPTQTQILAASGGASRAGIQVVAIIRAQGGDFWFRSDGTAPIASYTGGFKMIDGDSVIVYGLDALKNIHILRDANVGSVNVAFYTFRPSAGSGF